MFLYTGTVLTAMVDGRASNLAEVACGTIDRCPRPLRLGSATDKTGKLVSFFRGRMLELKIGVPEAEPLTTAIARERTSWSVCGWTHRMKGTLIFADSR